MIHKAQGRASDLATKRAEELVIFEHIKSCNDSHMGALDSWVVRRNMSAVVISVHLSISVASTSHRLIAHISAFITHTSIRFLSFLLLLGGTLHLIKYKTLHSGEHVLARIYCIKR